MDLQQRLDFTIDAALANQMIVGAVVTVARHGDILYSRAAGLADREAGTPVQRDSIFRLASVTKPIVSVTALAMVDAGVLSLDDAVSAHLPWFTPKYGNATPAIRIRHLLTHTAGLTYRYDESEISCGLANTDLDFEANFSRLNARQLQYEPGTAWEYSIAIDILGAVIARVHGGTLEQAVAHYVTSPLGMADTAFHVTDPGRLATPYTNGEPVPVRMADDHIYIDADGDETPFSPARIFNPKAFQSGGAGMAGTPPDLFKFFETLRTGAKAILQPQTFAAAISNQSGDVPGQDAGQGFGFFSAVVTDPALANTPQSPGTLSWGGIYGHNWFIDRANGLTVLIMTNTAPEGCNGQFTTDIRDDIYAAL